MWYEYEVCEGPQSANSTAMPLCLLYRVTYYCYEQHSGVTSLWQPFTVKGAITILIIYSVEVQSTLQWFPTLTMT